MKQCLVFLIPIAFVNTTEAQTPVSAIRGQQGCATCVRVEAAGTFGDTTGGPGELHGNIRSVLAYPTGGVFVATYAFNELVAQFGRDGKYQQRVGRLGAGPGEYRSPWPVGVRGDSLLVLDLTNSRLTYHSISRNTALGSTVMPLLSRAGSIAGTQDGAFVGNIVVETPTEAGYLFHRFTAAGRKLRSFGVAVSSSGPDLPFASVRQLGPSRDGGFWAAHFIAYEIEYYDHTDALKRTLRREVDWFPRGNGKMVVAQPDGEPPQPKVIAVQEDDAGGLWVLALIPDVRWRSAFGTERLAPRRPGGPQYFGVEDSNRLYDTVIEVIDPKRGIVLASHRVDDTLTGFAGAGVAWSSIDENRSGIVQVRLWNLSLREP